MHTVLNKYIYLLLLFFMPLTASDLQREQRWANQITDAILVGEPLWLEAGEHRFLGIYTEATTIKAHGAVILIHGVGVHPDWPDVINPLRERLPEQGWATLSLQMPVLSADAEVNEYFPIFPEILPRIDAAVRYLRQQGYATIVLAGHSLGSQMAAYWLSQSSDPEIKGFIAVGLSGAQRSGFGATLDYLEKINVPILDIYGEQDLRTVRKTAAARLEVAGKAGNKAYVQVEVNGAGHMFQGFDEALLTEVVNPNIS